MKPINRNFNSNVLLNCILSIQFNGDLKPVRKVVKRSNARATGKWPSWKMGMVQYESENEKNAFKLLDVYPEVLRYYPQPCQIRYILNGDTHIHYPDILVIFKDRKEIWEVKSLDDSLKPDVLKRSMFMTEQLTKYGYLYHIAIGEQLKQTPRLKNIEKLINNGRDEIDLQVREKARRLFEHHTNIAWGAFKNQPCESIQEKHICRLILEGELSCEINEPICSSTLITLSKNRQGAKS